MDTLDTVLYMTVTRVLYQYPRAGRANDSHHQMAPALHRISDAARV